MRAMDIMTPSGMDITKVRKNNCSVNAVPSKSEGSKFSRYCMVYPFDGW